MRPLLLDLYCGAGGAAMGYHRAGFEVVGVDIRPQRRYPFTFVQGDALTFAESYGQRFDVVHASPPCQAWSDLVTLHDVEHPQLIEPTRALLDTLGRPYVIENVDLAPLLNPIMLCGTMFPPLRVLRHRKFEAGGGAALVAPAEHPKHPRVFCRTDKRKSHFGKLDQSTAFVQVTGGGNCTVANARDAMGIDWMTKQELNQAIPPAYTEWIGRQLLDQLDPNPFTDPVARAAFDMLPSRAARPGPGDV